MSQLPNFKIFCFAQKSVFIIHSSDKKKKIFLMSYDDPIFDLNHYFSILLRFHSW